MKKKQAWGRIQIKRLTFFKLGIIIPSLFFLFTPLAFVQFICLFFIFLVSASRLYTEYLIRNISVTRMDRELRTFKHDRVRVEIRIENRGFLPAFMLVAGDLSGDLKVFKMQKYFCTLSRHSRASISWDGLCGERGVFSVGPAVVHGTDPLGLFPFQLTAEKTTRLYVYPVPRSIALKNAKGIPLGNIISSNILYEDITRIRSLRPYQSTDEKRRINWKASAKSISQTQEINFLVNEYDASASYPVMIFLNVNQNEYPVKGRSELIERVIEAAAALCLKASAERQELGIIIYKSNYSDGTTVIPPSASTPVPILECLASLDWLKPPAATDTGDPGIAHNSTIVMLNRGKHLSYGTRYIYTGPDLGDNAYITLNSLKKFHLYLEYLVIDERHLPHIVPGNSVRYQIKESGHDII